MIDVTGSVVTTEGEKVVTASIIIYTWQKDSKRPQKTTVDLKGGDFKSKVPKGSKYVVNIHAKGYGLVSKVFHNTVPTRSYELKQATIVQMNPSTGGIVRDSRNNCTGSLSARADWAAKPMAEVPLRINSLGQIASLGMSESLQLAYDYHAKRKPCDNGIEVSIPPNALNTNTSNVSVAISSIDLFSPDGMPGDYSTSDGSRAGFMESYGAFSIEVYDGEKSYNINKEKKATATVTFPVSFLNSDSLNIPSAVPVLFYDEESGSWKRDGEAKFDETRRTYVATISHFSAINLDLEKFNTACLRFKDQVGDGIDPDFTTPSTVAYRVEVTAPPTTTGGVPRVSTRDIHASDMDCPSPDDRQFALTRLPSDTDVSVVFFNNATTPQPYGVYVFRTGPTDTSLNDPTAFVCADLTKCGNFHLFDTNEFPTTELFITGCKNTSTGLILVSLAVGPSAAISFDPNDYNIRISRSGGSSSDCFAEYTLTTPTVVSASTSNVKLFQYSISIAALCGTGAYSTEAIELYDKSATPVVVSNTFYMVSCI